MFQRHLMSGLYAEEFIDLYLHALVQYDISLHQYGVMSCVVVKLEGSPCFML
jgi:hypothetical protein